MGNKQVYSKERKWIFLVCIVLLIIGMIAARGYGVGVDENVEIDIARLNLKEYVRLLGGEESTLFQYMDARIGDLMDSVEIDHGQAAFYLAASIVSVLRAMGRADLGMYAYHMCIYIWFLIGLLALYGTGKLLTGKWYWGCCAAGLVFLHPLFFGYAFTNNKDITMMSLAAVCIYTGIHFVEKKNIKWSILWAIAIAFAVNMRIIGLAYMGLFGLLYLIEFFQRPNRTRAVFLNGLLAIVVSVVVFIVITPATWQSLWGYFQYTMSNTISFSRHTRWNLYCGDFYNFIEKPFPWHYFLANIAVTTPLGILAVLLLGELYSFRTIFDKNVDRDEKKYVLLLLLIVWIPMAFFMIHGANVYGGWRHFYFIYPELALLAVYALNKICVQSYKAAKIIKVFLAVEGVFCVGLIISGHPFQAAYYNCLVKRPVAERFEYSGTEYYKEALEEILKRDNRNNILVSSDNIVCYYGIKQAWEILNPIEKQRICIAEPETDECRKADYHIYDESTLRYSNLIAEKKLEDSATVYVPEKKFDTQIGLDAYGCRIITIYYNSGENLES